jgi:hypothetical protein
VRQEKAAGLEKESFHILPSRALPFNAATSSALHFHNYRPQQ